MFITLFNNQHEPAHGVDWNSNFRNKMNTQCLHDNSLYTLNILAVILIARFVKMSVWLFHLHYLARDKIRIVFAFQVK